MTELDSSKLPSDIEPFVPLNDREILVRLAHASDRTSTAKVLDFARVYSGFERTKFRDSNSRRLAFNALAHLQSEIGTNILATERASSLLEIRNSHVEGEASIIDPATIDAAFGSIFWPSTEIPVCWAPSAMNSSLQSAPRIRDGCNQRNLE